MIAWWWLPVTIGATVLLTLLLCGLCNARREADDAAERMLAERRRVTNHAPTKGEIGNAT